jgi:iron-sulfur cluster repair protein YtfE (RIC family)
MPMEPNPEFPDFQRWWDEHSQLDRLVEELESALTRGALGPATAALDELASTLEAHFTVEEEVYFPLLGSLDPAHQPALDAARLGHDKLRERLEQLRQLVDTGEVPAARRALRVVLDRFRQHEEEEEKLVGRLERLTPPRSAD